MAVTFTQTQSLLQVMATTLSSEATVAGLASLSSGLTGLATEIGQSVTEKEFFGGGSTSFSASGGTGGATPTGGSSSGTGIDNDSAAIVWANILDTAASIISAHNSNVAREIAVNNDSTQGIVSIAYSLGMIENSLGTIADKQSTIADKQTLMEEYQKTMKDLAEGNGIHILGPYEYLANILLYKNLVEEGNILKEPTIQKSATKEARTKIDQYKNIIDDLPKEF